MSARRRRKSTLASGDREDRAERDAIYGEGMKQPAPGGWADPQQVEVYAKWMLRCLSLCLKQFPPWRRREMMDECLVTAWEVAVAKQLVPAQFYLVARNVLGRHIRTQRAGRMRVKAAAAGLREAMEALDPGPTCDPEQEEGGYDQ